MSLSDLVHGVLTFPSTDLTLKCLSSDVNYDSWDELYLSGLPRKEREEEVRALKATIYERTFEVIAHQAQSHLDQGTMQLMVAKEGTFAPEFALELGKIFSPSHLCSVYDELRTLLKTHECGGDWGRMYADVNGIYLDLKR